MTTNNLFPKLGTLLLVVLGSSLLTPIKAYGFTITENTGFFVKPILGGVDVTDPKKPEKCEQPAVCSGVGTNTISWGTPVEPTIPTLAQYIPQVNIPVTLGQPFKLADFKFQNGVIFSDTIIETINLNLTLKSDSSSKSFPIVPSIAINNTPNTTGNAATDADFVTIFQSGAVNQRNLKANEGDFVTADLMAVFTTNPFLINTNNLSLNNIAAADTSDLTLEILGFGPITDGIGFVTDSEGIVLYSTDPDVPVGIDTTPSIPEPSALSALFFLGGLGMLMKRKNNELL